MVAMAGALSASDVTSAVHADRAISDVTVIRYEETQIVASADLAGVALIGAAGDCVVVADLRNKTAAGFLLSVAVEQHAPAISDHRYVELERVFMGAADAV